MSSDPLRDALSAGLPAAPKPAPVVLEITVFAHAPDAYAGKTADGRLVFVALPAGKATPAPGTKITARVRPTGQKSAIEVPANPIGIAPGKHEMAGYEVAE